MIKDATIWKKKKKSQTIEKEGFRNWNVCAQKHS